jgi:hypothetical protein
MTTTVQHRPPHPTPGDSGPALPSKVRMPFPKASAPAGPTPDTSAAQEGH